MDASEQTSKKKKKKSPKTIGGRHKTSIKKQNTIKPPSDSKKKSRSSSLSGTVGLATVTSEKSNNEIRWVHCSKKTTDQLWYSTFFGNFGQIYRFCTKIKQMSPPVLIMYQSYWMCTSTLYFLTFFDRSRIIPSGKEPRVAILAPMWSNLYFLLFPPSCSPPYF